MKEPSDTAGSTSCASAPLVPSSGASGDDQVVIAARSGIAATTGARPVRRPSQRLVEKLRRDARRSNGNGGSSDAADDVETNKGQAASQAATDVAEPAVAEVSTATESESGIRSPSQRMVEKLRRDASGETPTKKTTQARPETVDIKAQGEPVPPSAARIKVTKCSADATSTTMPRGPESLDVEAQDEPVPPSAIKVANDCADDGAKTGIRKRQEETIDEEAAVGSSRDEDAAAPPPPAAAPAASENLVSSSDRVQVVPGAFSVQPSGATADAVSVDVPPDSAEDEVGVDTHVVAFLVDEDEEDVPTAVASEANDFFINTKSRRVRWLGSLACLVAIGAIAGGAYAATRSDPAGPPISRYPGCSVANTSLVGDGVCHGGEYNTEECGSDGGDCIEYNEKYPDCNVTVPGWVGNGRCDGGEYGTGACGWDGGDCIGPCGGKNASSCSDKYPNCTVGATHWIGDGICSGKNFNTAGCGWDGGDCIDFLQYPNCNVGYPTWIGDGRCHGGEYNTKKCGWDDGDCKEFNGLYPNCEVDYPYWIGDGRCDGGAYNKEECGFDGGDCG